ncbi:MAG: GNAT family N-acetyltransferase [Promethearchaeota archaeon]
MKIERANKEDMKTLTHISTITFDEDSRKHNQSEKGGPPGYDSIQWQNDIITKGIYYKIIHEEKIIGGVILFKKGRDHIEFGRIYILPDFQNKGFGTKVFSLLENRFSEIKKWTLNTPTWAIRNQHFYEKLGYIKIGEQTMDDGFSLILYGKKK